jgi:hypothetical protein
MNPKVGDLITLKPEYRDPEEEQGVMLILGQEKEWHQTLCVEIPCYKVLTSNGNIALLSLATYHAYEILK